MPLSFALQRQLSRFRRLPQSADVWEGAAVSMPMWVDDGLDGNPYRPRAAVWVSTTSQLAHLTGLKGAGEDVDVEQVLVALCEMGTSPKRAGHRPRAARVRDAALADALREALANDDVAVELVGELPALQDFLSATAVAMSQTRIPGALTAPGVTVDRLRSFAAAAKLFFEAAPWRHLNDGDLIRIEAPKSGRGMDLFGVLGSAGQEFGLGFFSSMKKYRQIMQRAAVEDVLAEGVDWAIYFSPGWETPPADLDAWDRYALPLAGPNAYPAALRLDLDAEPRRPDAGRLAHFEGILRALAATNEKEMDTGRWSHQVTTAEGERTYTLTLPDLLEASARPPIPDRRAMERVGAEIARALAGREFANAEEMNAFVSEQFEGRSIDDMPSTAAAPLERAQDLIYQAFETRGRRQLHLIRQALALSPDCCDAYLLLSERASSVAEIHSLLEQAVAAGERALGADAFTGPDTTFWADVTTRPYMRARAALPFAVGACSTRTGTPKPRRCWHGTTRPAHCGSTRVSAIDGVHQWQATPGAVEWLRAETRR